MKEKYHLKKYLLFSFGLAWIFQIAASVMALKGIGAGFTLLASVSMFGPFVAVWITCGGLKQEKTGILWKPQFKGKVRWWIVSWLLPILLSLTGCGLYFLILPDRFDPTASEYIIATVGEEVYLQSFGMVQPAVFMLITLFQILGGAFFNMFFALGEEAGWRGYLYPALKQKYGTTKGKVFGGIIWGIWHWPVMMLAGYEYGWSIFNAPLYLVLAGMLFFCVVTTAFGMMEDWLYERTGNIWASSLAHGAINAAAGFGMYFLKIEYAHEMYLGPVTVGMISGIPFFLLAGYLLVKELHHGGN
ncbi:MAG: CPBP family intramembrane metalloprotease [Lachnospiraceae bacterium]|nr:CPBP family intramembrane metalloprotease [Lachnospiraceae bacterium]